METVIEWVFFIIISMLASRFWKHRNISRPTTNTYYSDPFYAGPEPDCTHMDGSKDETTEPSVIYNDCWAVLEIAPTTDMGEIKRAYRALIKQYHPDIAGQAYNLRCARISEAYREALRSL